MQERGPHGPRSSSWRTFFQVAGSTRQVSNAANNPGPHCPHFAHHPCQHQTRAHNSKANFSSTRDPRVKLQQAVTTCSKACRTSSCSTAYPSHVRSQIRIAGSEDAAYVFCPHFGHAVLLGLSVDDALKSGGCLLVTVGQQVPIRVNGRLDGGVAQPPRYHVHRHIIKQE